ncbi:MAG: aminodeoxychorismate/anthranilate synthase component II [Gammaproteobacteria bacterium]|nr:aminodeoxychorismate/anthranilate synthase component II [Gammaproteobacteria bacterium]
MLLMIDNYDSFTYNLVQYFGSLGQEISVFRNDEITPSEIENMAPSHIVISPGPGNPTSAGISISAIAHFAGKIPILGVCLGHQSIGQAFGGKIVHAKRIMHGKTSPIFHNERDLFQGLKKPLIATRYHSLVVEETSLPAVLQVTAWTEQIDGTLDEIMGIQHKIYPLFGIQFHPESILTEQGLELLQNFLKIT